MIANAKEIEQLRKNGKIHQKIFDEIKGEIKVGVSAYDIDKLVGELCKKYGVLPGFLGVYDFPANICISKNDLVVHGIPRKSVVFNYGDVVKFDFGVKDKKIGINTDAAFTVIVGEGEHDARVVKFLETNKKALEEGVKMCKVGNKSGDVGHAIQKVIEEAGFYVVRDLTGHGLGYTLHEKPYMYNFGTPGTGVKLKEGMIIAIEPIMGFTSGEIYDKGTIEYYIADGSYGSQFEHTIVVTKSGPEIIV